jgi:hypothetical protein
MSALIKYDQARQALAACRNVDDIKDIRDKSEAMRLYAKQANDTELEQWAAEIKFRAQRAIGEISRTMEKQQGNAGKLPTSGKFKTEALLDAGISTSTAHRYEQLAAIPDAAVEAFIAQSKDAGKPVSAKAVMAQLAQKPRPTRAAPPAQAESERTMPSAPSTAPETDNAFGEDDTPDFVEKLREADAEIAVLTAQVETLNKKIEMLTQDDMAAAVADWAFRHDQIKSMLDMRTGEYFEANNERIRYSDLLKKLRKAAGVEKNGDLLAQITPRAEVQHG